MKILYLCNVNRDSKAAVGVFKKINSQIDILRKNNHVVHLAFYKTENVYSVIDSNNSVILSLELKGARGNQRTNQILSQLYRLLSDQRYSVIYSRYETYSVSLANFYKKASYSGCLVLLEIPTYPITQRITTIKTSLEQRRYKTAMHQLYNATINSLGISRRELLE